MGEASKIVSAVERSRVRYSGPTTEELAPTSVLEAREREEELASKANMKPKAPVVVGGQSEVTETVVGRLNGDPMVSEDVLLPSSAPSVCVPGVGMVMADNASETEQLGKVFSSVMDGGSSSGKVDGVGDLSHVIVANAKCKVSPKVGGGGKRKMEMESGGLLLMWNDDWDVSVKSYSVGHIDALVQCPGRSLWRCADQLGAWNKGKFGSIPRLVRETQKQLDDLLSVSTPLVRMDEVKRLEVKLNDLLSREECYWKLRSRADWLALGDRNTKYFHNKATGRKKKNAIVEIMTEDGRRLSTEEDIVSEIERYFGTIFSSASPSMQQVADECTCVSGSLASQAEIVSSYFACA
ncbi:hypothetical protein G4B88_018267 [Cannabis sativa]|uniref:Uncharacterized protein n=1 Tax=Cannabis sativa TaxID=3483 RepID=A0A7J6F2X8_CANSA|nr:hypothetical protein G4B88_018267 [Cannabis sativa]